jgi:hypothetical protein
MSGRGMSLPQTDSRSTQRARILKLLIDARGGEVSLPEILACAAQYNSRIFELRRLGFKITNRTEGINGNRRSWFRLVWGPTEVKNKTTEAREQMGPALPSTGSGLLFRDLPTAYRDPEEV